MKNEVKSKNGMQAIGPYSQGISFGNLLFCSGNIGVDSKTGVLVKGGIKEQTEQAFKNIKSVLEAGGSSLDNILKTNVYLKSMDDFVVMNEVYAKYVGKPYPARATVEVAGLPKGALVEIECIAYIPNKDNCCGGSGCGCC
jgi:2-iminobutanoate/2-iminopropanoate deaminase